MARKIITSGAGVLWETIKGFINDNFIELYANKADYVNGNLQLAQVAKANPLTATVSATAGNLNGTTNYAVTFVTSFGETGSGAVSTSVNPANKQVNLTNIPVSADSRVIARKIYRYPAGASDSVLKRLVTTINDNTTTTYTDDIPDGSLGTPIPWVNTTGGSISINNVNVANVSEFSTHMGYQAMGAGTGYANTAFGVYTSKSLTTGIRNTALGTDALQYTTTGARNTAVGVHAGDGNITGDDITAVGYGAGVVNTASKTTAFGSYALYVNTTGGTNTAIGYRALLANTTAANNVAIGSEAGKSLVTGAQNTIVGTTALFNGTGGSNTAVGWSALYSATSAASNVALGARAGYYETGSNKLFIDNVPRANEADGRVKAMLYGEFSADTATQKLTANANLTWRPAATVTPANNGEITFELTSDTSLAVKVKGSDGTVRSAVLTLAP